MHSFSQSYNYFGILQHLFTFRALFIGRIVEICVILGQLDDDCRGKAIVQRVAGCPEAISAKLPKNSD